MHLQHGHISGLSKYNVQSEALCFSWASGPVHRYWPDVTTDYGDMLVGIVPGLLIRTHDDVLRRPIGPPADYGIKAVYQRLTIRHGS